MLLAIIALWRREIVKFVRDRSRVFGALAQPLGFWLVIGLGFKGSFQMPGATASTVDYMEYLFPGIVAMILLFTAIFSTISIVEERKAGFLQAALVAPIPRLALVFGTTLGGTTLALVEALLFLALAPTVGLTPSVPGLLVAALVCALTGLAFTALGVLIAWRMDSTRGFHAVMNLFLLPLWLLSGAAFPLAGAPDLMRWLMLANPVSYSVSALRQALYWPAATPDALASVGVAVGITALFALVILVLTARTVRRPLYD